MNSEIKLTPELERQIFAAIRAGGFPRIAAMAFGVPVDFFEKWIAWGTNGKYRQPYTRFARGVKQAQAQARLKAEMATMEKDPRTWLKHGPGKEIPDPTGWSAMVRPEPGKADATVLEKLPEFISFLMRLRDVLIPYPIVLEAVLMLLNDPGDLFPDSDSDALTTDSTDETDRKGRPQEYPTKTHEDATQAPFRHPQGTNQTPRKPTEIT